jgi:heme exporter protein CcmB
MGSFFRVVWLVVRKDLTIEMRSREMLYTTIFFAVSCVLVFSFGFVREGQPLEDAAAGILWIAIAFAGTLALGRAFERERYNDALRALLLAPVDRPAIFVGKLLGILGLLAAVEVVVVPLVALLFRAPLLQHPGMIVMLLAGGTIGFASVGTLFAAMLVRTHTRGVLLPVLLYPVTVPALIAGVSGTLALIQAEPNLPMARFWMAFLGFFDIVTLTIALWSFEPVMTD